MTDQRHQPFCHEDEAIDAISLLCAGGVDDYEITAASKPLTWYEATVQCADDGNELIIGAGDFSAGQWTLYRCANADGQEIDTTPGAYPFSTQVTLPDTTMYPPANDVGGLFVLLFLIVALVVGKVQRTR